MSPARCPGSGSRAPIAGAPGRGRFRVLARAAPASAVEVERLRLPTREVERAHELAPLTFAERRTLDELLELCDRRLATREPLVEQVCNCAVAQLLESPCLRLGESLVPEVCKGLAAPECERVRDVTGAEVRLEPVDVELARLEPDAITGRRRRDPIRAERLPEPRDVDLNALGRVLWGRLSPELLDDSVVRQGLVAMDEQQREERALAAGRDRARGRCRSRARAGRAAETPSVTSLVAAANGAKCRAIYRHAATAAVALPTPSTVCASAAPGGREWKGSPLTPARSSSERSPVSRLPQVSRRPRWRAASRRTSRPSRGLSASARRRAPPATPAAPAIQGEPKNEPPFTRPATVVVGARSGLDWTWGGIGAAAGIGITLAGAGAVLAARKSPRTA